MFRPRPRMLAAGLAVSALAIGAPAAVAFPTEASTREPKLTRWFGDPSSATGAALGSGACDVNGDGYDDAVVGAWFWDKAPNSNVGAAYVLLGGSELRGGDLASPSAVGAVRIDGPAQASALTGFSVGCLGDVNGDGLDDIGVSHYTAQRMYVVLGERNFTGVELDALGDRGYIVQGPADGGNVGFALAGLGDIDGDGLADFGIAEVAADTHGRTNNGRIWVVAGQDDIATITLANSDRVLMTVDGAGDQERLGSLSAAGDVNGDGVDDLIVGSYVATPWGTSVAATGAAHVIWGGGDTTEIDLADLGDAGFTIAGPLRQRDRLGVSVAPAGDINGDGLADLVIGADGVSNAATGDRSGGAAVVFGAAGTQRVYVDPAATSAAVYTCAETSGDATCVGDPVARGYWIDGAARNDSAGYSVAGIGDVNGDGTPDLAIGAYGYDPMIDGAAASGAGATYVVHGQSTSTATIALGSLSPEAGYRIDGLAAGDRFGRAVAEVGDVDGDGRSDFAVGADFAARPLGSPVAQTGEVLIVSTPATVTATTISIDPIPSIAFGKPATIVARVEGTGTPTGTVTFTVGSVAETVPVVDGLATWQVPARTLAPGTHSVQADYSGDSTHLASKTTASATVTKAASTTTLTPAVRTIPSTQRLKVTVQVRANGALPTGKITIRRGTTVLATAQATAANGAKVTVTLPRLPKGSIKLTAGYAGSPRVAASTSAVVTVTVR